MEKEELVNRTQAEKLKELGFDWEVEERWSADLEAGFTLCPVIPLVLKWLRDVKRISVNCSMTTGGAAKYTVMEWVDVSVGWDTLVVNLAGTYEEAESKGVDWVLDYLTKKV